VNYAFEAVGKRIPVDQLRTSFAKDGFKPLFNGKSLDGWDGDPHLWKVQDGMIVGSTEGNPLKYNNFLSTKKSYANFVLRAQAKLRNHNSGIQFRSELLPDLKWAVRGYQADMAENNYWGCIYDERSPKKRGILVNGWDKAQKVVKLKDWNDLELRCAEAGHEVAAAHASGILQPTQHRVDGAESARQWLNGRDIAGHHAVARQQLLREGRRPRSRASPLGDDYGRPAALGRRRHQAA
jgi:hypothetical protein